ncbi:YhgE/Pip domain-containing protein [Curvibacter delicatus]|uniref:YhgE/Pip domain-containing protein n=1 Tax=Curvibacter delicatus TaxID=80879 RepID=UPI001FE01C3B|nr:YhgE/Pip domain-containing protein [Curvibacter delicatus]
MSSANPLSRAMLAIWQIVRTDLALFRRSSRLWLAVLAIALVPAAYALIYLSSVWDPNAKTSDLPVGIVNLDEGFDYRGRNMNVGAELTSELIKSATFGFRKLDAADAARQAVKHGSLAFAIIIPRDFSASAVPGEYAGAGTVTVVLSEGNNYAAAGFARRFAVDLGHQVNEALNEKRWEQVLLSADGSGKSLDMLKAGMAELRTGVLTYNDGLTRYSGTVVQLANGFKQVGAGIRTMESKLPPEAELKAFKAGTQRLNLRQRELGTGLEQLQAGALKLTEGAVQMQQETAGIPFVGDKISASAGELAAGGQQLNDGLMKALDANARLTRGAARVEEGADKLVDGASALGEGLRTLAEKLPEDARLDAFAKGSGDLLRGATKLRTGIELVASALPTSVSKLDGSASGLADSVKPALEVMAPVANNGSAFAPNMIAMALWLGAVMAVYLFNVRVLAVEHAGAPALVKTLGKFVAPALVVLVQTGLTLLMLVFGLGITVPDYASLILVMLAAGQAFLAIVYLLLRALGEAGKLLVVLLLTLQLAAGGGVMPIELTADFFQAVHAWLPFTWVVKALRASLFGAFDHGWLSAWLELMLIGALALLLASLVRHWQTVPAADYKPGIEI